MKTMQFLILVTACLFFAACATKTPKELTNARLAYQAASVGPAAKLAPAELHKAQEALKLAEKSFEEDDDSYKIKDLSYVAQRKAELAVAYGVMAADKEKKEKADADFQKKQTELVSQGKQDLIDSEKKTADALAELGKLAALKEEERGLVLTLSGSILFRTNESTLLPSAQGKLDDVANALLSVRERNLIIEGYTDSQGSDSYNQDLSLRRATAVSNFIVQRGYPSDRIQMRGMGESNPIADNTSVEGRANNRRVEIIIQRDSQMNEKYSSNTSREK